MSNEKEKLSKKFDEQLEKFLDSIDEDYDEAKLNVDAYFEMIDGDDDMRAVYGNLYHEAIKIKASVRERSLKVLNLLKERIAKLENDELKKDKGDAKNDNGGMFNHKEFSEQVKKLKKEGTLQSVSINTHSNNVENNTYSEEMDYQKKKEDNG